MINSLEPILTYALDEVEAKAFKLSLLWKDLSKKEFPDIRDVKQAKEPKDNDPRTTLLFKYCLKLAIETKGLIPDDEYGLYITAQLQVLKECADGLPIITPACLVGIKAWRRWKLWRNRFNKSETNLAGRSSDVIVSPESVKTYVKDSVKFIEKHKNISAEKLKKYVLAGDISPFYLVLSKNPLIEKGKIFGIDLSVYEISITDPLKQWFVNTFRASI